MPTVGEELVVPFTIGEATFPDRYIAALTPWLTPDLERYARAIAALFALRAVSKYPRWLELAEETGEDGRAGYVPAWGELMNPAACPNEWLPWLSMFVGVQPATGATESERREALLAHAGFARGTLGSVETKVRSVLGASPFRLAERTGPAGESSIAYWFVVYVGTGQKTTALYEAINSVVPAGVFYTITESTNTWLNGVKKHWSEVTVTKASEMVEPNY